MQMSRRVSRELKRRGAKNFVPLSPLERGHLEEKWKEEEEEEEANFLLSRLACVMIKRRRKLLAL